MLEQTLKPYVTVPGVREALAAGLGPYTNPTQWRATRVGRSGTRGVIYAIAGNWFLIVEGSAAMEDPENQKKWRGAENVFVQLLGDQLLALRPRKLVVAVFSRLVRSEEFSGPLQAVVKRHVEEVHAGDLPIFEPATDAGKNLWMMGAWFSSMERTAILRRMTTGALASAAQGVWTMPERCLAFGYRLTEDRRVEPDPEARSAVAAMIDTLATPGLTYGETVQRLAAAGVKSRRLPERVLGSDGSVDGLRDYSSYILGLVGWLHTYRTGEYVYRRTNPLPGEKQLGGFRVQGAEEDGVGYLEATYNFGVPDGGWAAPETIDAAEQNWNRSRPRGGEQGPRVRPLTNVVAWQSDGALFKLIARGDDRYYLLRRDQDEEVELVPGEPATAGQGWRTGTKLDGECIATIRASELHASIADSVMTAIRDGVEVRRLDGWARLRSLGGTRLVDARANRLAILDRQLGEAENRFRGARRLANAVARNAPDDEELDKEMAADIAAAMVEVRRLRKERELLNSQRYLAPDFGTGFEAEAAFLARAMANLATSNGAVARDMARALAEILQDFRLDVDQVEARWSCNIILPVDGSALRFAITGTVPNRVRPNGVTWNKLSEELLERVLWKGQRLSELHAFYGRDTKPELWRAGMQRVRESMGLPSRCARILFSAPPQLGMIVYAHLFDLPVPVGTDEEWVSLVVRTYTNPDLSWKTKWHVNVSARQTLLDAVIRVGDEAPVASLLDHLPLAQILSASDPSEKRSRSHRPPPPSVIRMGRWGIRNPGPSDRRVRTVGCPHGDCGGRCTVALWTPETAWGFEASASVICPTCRRIPVAGSPTFPDAFLHLGVAWTDPCGRVHPKPGAEPMGD